jgi:PAS domain S-box-containing protein
MKTLKFKNRIYLGFGLVFLIMLILALYSNYKLIGISQNLELVYEHPFKVSNSIRDFQVEIYNQARLVRDLSIFKKINQIDSIKVKIVASEKTVSQHFNSIYSLYLGDRADIDSLYEAIEDWKIIKDKIYIFAKENSTDSLERLINYQNYKLVSEIISHTKIISDYASNKAKSALNQSINDKQNTTAAVLVTLILTSLIVVFVSYQISKSITNPIRNFISQANSIIALKSEKSGIGFQHEEDLFNYTLHELASAYQSIEQQNEEIKRTNEQLSTFNKSLEENVNERTLKLQESEERFRSAFETSAIGMALVSTTGKFFQVNPSLSKILGYSNEELLLKSFQEITHPDDLQRDVELVEKVKRGEISNFQIEKRYLNKNNEVIWANVSVALVRDKNDCALYFVAQIENITKRKLVELELKSEQFLVSALMENIPANIYFKDKESRFIRVNSTLLKLFGLENTGQVIGKTDFDFFTKEHAQQAFVDEQEIIRTGKSIKREEKETWPDTDDTWVSTVKIPLRDDKNEIIGIFGISIDITKNKIAEQKIQEANKELSIAIKKEEEISRQYLKLFENLTVGLTLHEIICNENNEPIDYRFIDVNPAFEKLTGLKAKDIKGKRVLEILPDLEKSWIENYGHVALTGEDIEFEDFSHELNKYFYVHAYSPQDKQFAVITEDVTQRKLTEIQLIETNKSLEEMVYIASHDLQVPLVSMEGYATELLQNYGSQFDEEGKYCLVRLQANARRMHKLVLSLLDISRLNTKRYPFEMFKLKWLIGKIIKDLALTIEKQQATIEIGELPEIFADKIRIESVFRNLITNSLNYGGNVITLNYNDNTICVKDNGIGIPVSQLERIFNPGERLKKNDAEGVGMGLTFCKKVIDLHNWKIWAESEGENKGATFKIKIT